MNYLELIRYFWKLDNAWQFTCCETRLYFYLVETANSLGWANSFIHGDDKTAANVGVSKNTFKTARNRLSQAQLISFKEGGKGHANKARYQILTPNHTPKVTPNPIPKVEPKVEPLLNKLNQTKLDSILPPTPPTGEMGGEIKGKGKKVKSKTSVPGINIKARVVFEQYYSSIFERDYYWTAKDAGNMTSILNKIKFQREKKELPVGDEDILHALGVFLSLITDGWIFENFSVSNINSKFNEIVSQAKVKARASNNANRLSGAEQTALAIAQEIASRHGG